MKKIIFIDIDGTLCNSKSEITDRTINAINNFQDNGGIVVISSGRNIKYIESLNTSALYFIALNGSIIYDCSDKKIIYQSNISQGLNETLYLLANEFNLNVSFYSYYDKYCNHDEKNSVVIKENYQFFLNSSFNQIVFWSDNFEMLLAVKKRIKDFSTLQIVNQSRDILYEDEDYPQRGRFLDITNNGVSKGNSIKILLNYLGLMKKDSIAIGDGINDLSMFEVVGTKVAMGNADSFLKENADYITLSNDENGVAYYLENLLK